MGNIDQRIFRFVRNSVITAWGDTLYKLDVKPLKQSSITRRWLAKTYGSSKESVIPSTRSWIRKGLNEVAGSNDQEVIW